MFKNQLILVTSIMSLSASAFAQGSNAPSSIAVAPAPAANTSVAAQPSAADKSWLERLKITYSATYDGPPISALDSNFRSDSGTGFQDEGAPLGVRNKISFGYPINDKVTLTPVVAFSFRAVPEGKNALNDAYLRLGNSNILSDGAFTLPAQTRVYLPWSDKSKAATLRTALLAGLNPTYAIPDSKFTVNAEGILKANFHQQTIVSKAGTTQADLELYLTPAIAYQALDNVSLSLGYNTGATRQRGHALSDLDNGGTSIQPGIDWDVFKSLTLSPSVYIFTGNRVAPDTTVTELGLTWKLM